MHNADDSTIQDRNPLHYRYDITNGDSGRELVERVASSEEDGGGEAPG